MSISEVSFSGIIGARRAMINEGTRLSLEQAKQRQARERGRHNPRTSKRFSEPLQQRNLAAVESPLSPLAEAFLKTRFGRPLAGLLKFATGYDVTAPVRVAAKKRSA